MESGLSSKKMLDRHEYERLIKFADPEMIKRALEGEFGKYEPRQGRRIKMRVSGRLGTRL